MTISEDNKTLIIGDLHGRIRFWDTAAQKEIQATAGHNSLVLSLASCGNQLCASGGYDGFVCLWQLPSGEANRVTRLRHGSGVTCLAFSPDQSILASGGENNSVVLWNVRSGTRLRTIETLSPGLRTLAFHPDGKLFATGGSDGRLTIWDAENGKIRREFTLRGGAITSVGYCDPRHLFVATSRLHQPRDPTGSLYFWDVDHEERPRLACDFRGCVHTIAIVRETRLIVTVDYDGRIKGWHWQQRPK
jgi:WD40 repeat protein